MKKILSMLFCLLATAGFSAKNPTITMQTQRVPGTPIKLVVRTETPSSIEVDWGNGELQKVETETDNTEITAPLKGSIVKLYGDDIIYLDCSNNDIVDVNLTKAIRIAQFYGDKNRLEALDVTNNIYLIRLSGNGNMLKDLNLEKNRKLTGLYMTNNKFDARTLNKIYAQLPSRRTMPDNITIRVAGNPGAETSNTDSATARNWKIDTKGSNTGGLPLILTFDKKPGEEIAIELRVGSTANVGIDWGDGEQSVAVAPTTTAIKGKLAKGNQVKIYGDNITFIKCEKMKVTEVDIAAGAQIQQAYFGYNALTDIDVSKNILLIRLGCNDNQLKKIDIANNPKLTGLYFQNNILDVAALNAIYDRLPARSKMAESVNFRVTGNPDAEKSNIATATSKNWLVDIVK